MRAPKKTPANPSRASAPSSTLQRQAQTPRTQKMMPAPAPKKAPFLERRAAANAAAPAAVTPAPNQRAEPASRRPMNAHSKESEQNSANAEKTSSPEPRVGGGESKTQSSPAKA